MSYHLASLGAEPPPQEASLPPDVSPTLFHEMYRPVEKQRGWVAVPTFDMRQYVQAQLLTFAAGFVVGMGMGAVFGNLLAGKKAPGLGSLIRNPRRRRSSRRRSSRRVSSNARRQSPRRASSRRRKRGRPSASPAHETGMTVTINKTRYDVDVIRGAVMHAGRRLGSVYDLGTSFRAIPLGDGEVRGYGTLAGAVKHVLRAAEKAA